MGASRLALEPASAAALEPAATTKATPSPAPFDSPSSAAANADSGPLGGFSYTAGRLMFDNPMAVRNYLSSFEGRAFIRRKAVLMQLSKVKIRKIKP